MAQKRPRPNDRTLDEHLHNLIAQGNYEAYKRLAKRYQHHASCLCRGILKQYPKVIATHADLMTVCSDCFVGIVKKYDSQLSSFFSFWKEATMRHVMDYILDSLDSPNDSTVQTYLSLDDEFADHHPLSAYIYEKDDDNKRVFVFEIENIIARHKNVFRPEEIAVITLILEGYTIKEIENCGFQKLSALYLTLKSAIRKLKRIYKKTHKNKR